MILSQINRYRARFVQRGFFGLINKMCPRSSLTHLPPVPYIYVSASVNLRSDNSLFSAKPLSKQMLAYCQLDHEELSSVKF